MHTVKELHKLLPGLDQGVGLELIIDCGYNYKIYSIDGVRQEWTYKDTDIARDTLLVEITGVSIIRVR